MQATLRRGVVALAVVAGSFGPTTAHAQPPPPAEAAAAAEEYDRGLAAHQRGDLRAAAAHFARADAMAPDPVALEAALRAAVAADDPVLAMRLVDRADRRRPHSAAIAAAATELIERHGARVSRITIACTGCTATVDGEEVSAGASLVVAPGRHAVVIRVGTRVEPQRLVDVAAGSTRVESPRDAPRTASFPPPPPGPPPPEAPEAGLSPVVFWIGAAATAVLGGLTIASGVDVLDRAAAFEAEPTASKAAEGQAAETRSYVLGAATGIVGAATITVGLFVVDW